MRACRASQSPRFAQRRWRSAASADLEHHRACGLRVDPPAGVNHYRAGTTARAQPITNHLRLQHQLGHVASLRTRLGTRRQQRAVRDADGWQTAGGAQVQGQACPPWMVAAAGVDDEHVGLGFERVYCFSEQSALAHREQPRHVGRIKRRVDDRGLEYGCSGFRVPSSAFSCRPRSRNPEPGTRDFQDNRRHPGGLIC